MRILCRLGFHKWSWRELHVAEVVVPVADSLLMGIIERCDCGETRIPPSGEIKPTMKGMVVPQQFMPPVDAP